MMDDKTNDNCAGTGNEGKMSDTLKWFAFMSYGVGHVLNDLVASMWFTYALVFYHYVMRLSSVNAGVVVLVGQLTDAVATAAIGVLSDNLNVYCTDRYGRRKTWHLFGEQSVYLFIFMTKMSRVRNVYIRSFGIRQNANRQSVTVVCSPVCSHVTRHA